MSDISTAVVADPNAEAAADGEQAEVKEIDWKAEARKHEQRAKENAAKAKANEGAAQRLAEIEEANKTAEQKAADRIAEAEKRAADLEARANRATAANEHGVPEALLAGPVSGSPEDLAAFAAALIEFRGEQGTSRLHVSGEGKSPSKQVTSELQAARELFGRSD